MCKSFSGREELPGVMSLSLNLRYSAVAVVVADVPLLFVHARAPKLVPRH
jgi:hypothetical protein